MYISRHVGQQDLMSYTGRVPVYMKLLLLRLCRSRWLNATDVADAGAASWPHVAVRAELPFVIACVVIPTTYFLRILSFFSV
jgi:hypothetical protein